MIDEATITRAVELLQLAAPNAKVFLYGSYARGEANDESDLDLLVVEPEVWCRRNEIARLREVLRPLRIPADVLVVDRQTFATWTRLPGVILDEPRHSTRNFRAISFGVRIWSLCVQPPPGI